MHLEGSGGASPRRTGIETSRAAISPCPAPPIPSAGGYGNDAGEDELGLSQNLPFSPDVALGSLSINREPGKLLSRLCQSHYFSLLPWGAARLLLWGFSLHSFPFLLCSLYLGAQFHRAQLFLSFSLPTQTFWPLILMLRREMTTLSPISVVFVLGGCLLFYLVSFGIIISAWS